MKPKIGGPRKMPTLKKAAETPAAAPAALWPPVSPASVPIRPPQPTAPNPSRNSAPQSSHSWPGWSSASATHERPASTPMASSAGTRRRWSSRSLTSPLSGLPRAPANWQKASMPGGDGDAVAPVRVQEQHELRQRGELDHAEKERREPHHPDVAGAQHGGEPGLERRPVRRLVAGDRRQALVDLRDRHRRRPRPVPLAGRRVAVEDHRDDADDEGEAGGEDEPGLPAVRGGEPRA